MDHSTRQHSPVVLEHWGKFRCKLDDLARKTTVNGRSLDIATVVAVARYNAQLHLDPGTLVSIRRSADALQSSLREGHVIYGVNTGFGGSADTRTRQVEELQRTLIRELHCGIIVPPPKGEAIHTYGARKSEGNDIQSSLVNGQGAKRRLRHTQNGTSRINSIKASSADYVGTLQNALPTDEHSTSMPEVWVRASILVRLNSLASAYSGVRPILVTTMTELLHHDILPRIPLRGSISASGDLSPLSYIAGTMMGKRTLTVSAGAREIGQRRFTTADIALAEASIEPLRLGPKEGLAVVNGTAVSTAVGALAMHDTHGLVVLSQVLTAMSVEALGGTSESFDPFFAKVRPHPGQIEAGHNIFQFLSGSQLIQNPDGSEEGSLRQDRYSIRTASQWIGPVLEDLLLAHQQVTIECNSVTDNPLIDGKRMLHGGNFQAKSITSAMEKTRLALQSLGRMLFTQCTEIINPKTNRGLPPNLVAGEPNSSWVMKGVDIMIAALQSELGFLANPVGTHVQTAEMGNQSLNSLALISARYCHTALDVLSQLAAGHLFALCQALDLRVMHIGFLESFEPVFRSLTSDILAPLLKEIESLEALHAVLWKKFMKGLEEATTMNSEQRFTFVLTSLQSVIFRYLSVSDRTVPAIDTWTENCRKAMLDTHGTNQDLYSSHLDAVPYLGKAGRRMYTFVRHTLGVPFIQAQHIRSPDPQPGLPRSEDDGVGLDGEAEKDHLTIGSFITIIYGAICNGSLYVPVMECLEEAQHIAVESNPASMKASKAGRIVDSLVSESKISV